MEILKGVIKKSIFIIVPAIVLAGYFIGQRQVPLGIFMGWLLGVINFRQLTRNIEGVFGSQKATFKLVFLSLTRLMALFAAIAALLYYRVVNPFGLLFGFSVVFMLVLVEGAKFSKQ